ncbi:MAG: nucleotidyl transferase AbiEii/AbiGii toxin family protein [Actinomycetota bacterium]|nr:nucleotidyl transferase AbiEii/AbiGii toxin family protein [Actinomycetota bacterium]
MLEQQELRLWEARFGVAPEQIRKDHLISHLLAGIAHSTVAGRAIFFGGTALARTHLGDRRVSEDIDLWAEPTQEVFSALADELPRHVRREYPGLRIERDSPAMGNVIARDGTQVRLQVVAYGAEHNLCVELERRDIDLRYTDLQQEAELTVPTRSSFVAMKHLAWADRTAPRDLVDLVGLASIGALDAEADAIVDCLRGFGVRFRDIDRLPDRTRRSWVVDLAHQMGQPPDPNHALSAVQEAWARSLGWD